jgi:hypothetical protein
MAADSGEPGASDGVGVDGEDEKNGELGIGKILSGCAE